MGFWWDGHFADGLANSGCNRTWCLLICIASSYTADWWLVVTPKGEDSEQGVYTLPPNPSSLNGYKYLFSLNVVVHYVQCFSFSVFAWLFLDLHSKCHNLRKHSDQ